MDFRTTPNGKHITLTPTVEGRPLFKVNEGLGPTLVVVNNFTLELDGIQYTDFMQGDTVGLHGGWGDGTYYIVAEAAIGGRRRRLYSRAEAEIAERYGEVVARFTIRDGRILPESLEDLNQFSPLDATAVDTRLRIALGRFEFYLADKVTEADRQLIRSMLVALEALAGTVTLPRHHVVQTVRTFVGEMEQTRLPNDEIDLARNAYGELCEAWGFELVDGEPRIATPAAPCHAAALAGHLATLIEFHHDDDPDEQHDDPILEAFHPSELSSLRLKTQSGRQFMVTIVELPA